MYSQDKLNSLTQTVFEELPRWEVTLSDGSKKYSCDDPQEQSWRILKEYCLQHNLKITDMSVGFRSNVKHLPSNKEGYFFRRMERGSLFQDGEQSTQSIFLVGFIHENKIHVSKYKVPEMILEGTHERDIEENIESVIG